MKKLALFAIAVFVIAGCASNVWVKPNGTQEEFSKDRYACMQESQQRVSSTYVNRYAGVSSSDVQTNEGLFNACMNARGWYLRARDDSVKPFDQPQSQQIETRPPLVTIKNSTPAINLSTDPEFLKVYIHNCNHPETCVKEARDGGLTDTEIYNLGSDKVKDYMNQNRYSSVVNKEMTVAEIEAREKFLKAAAATITPSEASGERLMSLQKFPMSANDGWEIPTTCY